MNAHADKPTIRERIERSRALGREMRRAREEAVQQLRAVAESLRHRNDSRTFKPLP
jgi:uncharacterized protein YbjQ (UPF0145 family)